MEIYKINHVYFKYNEEEKEEFLKNIAGIYAVSDFETIAEKESDIARILFKEPKMDKGVSRHTYTYHVHVNLDSAAQFEFNQYPKFVKNKEGKVGILIGHYDIGWTLLFPSDPARFKVTVSQTKSTYSHNTKRYTDTVTSFSRSFNDLFEELDKPKLSVRERFIQSLK